MLSFVVILLSLPPQLFSTAKIISAIATAYSNFMLLFLFTTRTEKQRTIRSCPHPRQQVIFSLLLVYFFKAELGLRCFFAQVVSLVTMSKGDSCRLLIEVGGLLIVVASLVAEHRL